MHTYPPDPSVLAHCVALVVANNERDAEALMRLAEKLRFGDIAAWSPSLGHARFTHRLVFFLVHFDFNDADKLALLKSLRHSGSVTLCYAPVVIFLREASALYDEKRAGPFFYEVIQRAGDPGFGYGNFRALFESIERAQKAAAQGISPQAVS